MHEPLSSHSLHHQSDSLSSSSFPTQSIMIIKLLPICYHPDHEPFSGSQAANCQTVDSEKPASKLIRAVLRVSEIDPTTWTQYSIHRCYCKSKGKEKMKWKMNWIQARLWISWKSEKATQSSSEREMIEWMRCKKIMVSTVRSRLYRPRGSCSGRMS